MQEEWKKWHSWSRSREYMFQECQRQYYYQHVISHEQGFNDIIPTLKRNIKKMNTMNFLLGNIVHEAIKRQINQIRMMKVVQLDIALSSSTNFIDRKILDIIENKKAHIIESMNGICVPEEDFLKIAKEAKRQLNIFFGEYFGFYSNLNIMYCEDILELYLDDYRFWLIPDLIAKSEDKYYLVDWKTNSNYKGVIDNNQMKLYSLWLLNNITNNLNDLVSEVIMLDIGESKGFVTSIEELNEYEKYLCNKSKELYELIDSKNSEKDFFKCSDEYICTSCGFKQYCDKYSL